MPTLEQRDVLDRLRQFPADLDAVVKHLTPEQLTTPYVAGEWTVAQIVHHLADSHMNAFLRTKRILAEDRPFRQRSDPNGWANRPDAVDAAIEPSLQIIKGVHQRWVLLVENLSDADWQRVEACVGLDDRTLMDVVSLFATHGERHLHQITATLAAQHP
jgi:hypothetical protein